MKSRAKARFRPAKWTTVSIELSPQALRLVKKMLTCGLYGFSVEDVLQRLLFEKLREFEVRRRGGREVVLRRQEGRRTP